MAQTIHDQEQLALGATKSGFVCMVCSKETNFLWVVTAVKSNHAASEWFDEQRKAARVYKVYGDKAKLWAAK